MAQLPQNWIVVNTVVHSNQIPSVYSWDSAAQYMYYKCNKYNWMALFAAQGNFPEAINWANKAC